MTTNETPSSRLGHLQRVSIQGLFGAKDVDFVLSQAEPTILTGSNGSGKSTILRIINAVGTGDWAGMARLPFTTASLQFAGGSEAAVLNEDHKVRFRLGSQEWSFDPADVADLDEDDIDTIIADNARQVGPDRFEYRGEVVNRWELTDIVRSGLLLDSANEDLEWVTAFTDAFSILFVTDQRLIVPERPMRRFRPARFGGRAHSRSAVVDARNDMRSLMREALSEYGSQSQVLDSDFPYRVVDAMQSENDIDIASVAELNRAVRTERSELQRVGLLPPDLQPGPFQELPLDRPEVAPVIQTFLEDTISKFKVLADLRERLGLFTSFLNQHYADKEVRTNPSVGFEIVVPDRMGDDDEGRIAPTLLSSGEQQILVLAYEILFRSVNGSLVLIDEPELSLHVVWQDTFVEDVTAMGAVRDIQFLLATHSPALIAGRADLKRSLDVTLNR